MWGLYQSLLPHPKALFPPLREDPPIPHMLPSTIRRKEGRKDKHKHKREAYGVLSYATKL
jgi:hypothetical protein